MNLSQTPTPVFNLSLEEQQLTQDLQQVIAAEIALHGGMIPFSRYMELALYYPGLGYYANHLTKFGKSGDFITAPHLSQLFGYAVAAQIAELMQAGVKPQLLEFGAGDGNLAADILARIGSQLEQYFIVELSADLAARQRQMLQQRVPDSWHKVSWLKQLPNQFQGVMLANEVLDAQPCELVHFATPQQIHGVGVTSDGNEFSYQPYPLTGELFTQASKLPIATDDYLTEINVASQAFIRSLASHLECGAIILFDYGYGESEYYHPERNRGSLRGFYRHQVLDSVLVNPGLIDITASVNWSSIVTAAVAADLELIGYTTQAHFLLNCGLTELMLELQPQLGDAQYLQLAHHATKLVASNEMGEAFKVCGLSKGLALDEWRGFASGERSYSL